MNSHIVWRYDTRKFNEKKVELFNEIECYSTYLSHNELTKIVKYYTRWFISHYSEKIIMSIFWISSFNLIKKFNVFFVEFCCIISSHSSEFTVKGNLCDKNCEVLYQIIYFTLYAKIDNFEIVHFIIQSHWKVQLFFRWIFLYHIFTL